MTVADGVDDWEEDVLGDGKALPVGEGAGVLVVEAEIKRVVTPAGV